jgi:hypothetical protein
MAADHDQPSVVFTKALRASGLQGSEIHSRTATMRRLRRGAYCTETVDDPRVHHILETRAALGLRQDVVASHASSALIHGLSIPPDYLNQVHLTATRAGVKDSVRHGVHLHSGPVAASDVVHVEGLATTIVPRTVVECALTLPFLESVVVADQALQRPDVTRQDLERALTARGRRKGVAQARRVLAACDAGAESPGETRLRLILAEGGFETCTQVEIRRLDGSFVARVDLKLRSHPVVMEFDGRAKYQMGKSVESAHWQEKRRFDELHELGIEGFRVVWNHLAQPTEIIRRAHLAIARAEQRGLGESLFILG